MTPSLIQLTVLRRVRTIYALRRAASGTTASILALAFSLYVIGREVWVARVWENAPSIANVGAEFRFFTYAFLHTDVSVQFLLVVSLFAFIVMTREIIRVIDLSRSRFAVA